MGDRMGYDELWAWVESDEAVPSPEQGVRLLCALRSFVYTSGVAAAPGEEWWELPDDCVCPESPHAQLDRERGTAEGPVPYWQNEGTAIRWMARTAREAVGAQTV